jgi:HPt (histidine-containing phosphotransfer) domain-containing protein
LLAGCNAFVGKPIDLDHLQAVVRQHVSEGRLALSQSSDHDFGAADDGDSLEYQEYVQGFVASLPETVAQLRAARLTNDDATLAAISHTLKGSGGTLGFPELSEAAERLELAVVGHRDDRIQSELEQLAALVDRLQAVSGNCSATAR